MCLYYPAGAKTDATVLNLLIQKKLPKLHAHLFKNNVHLDIVCLPWSDTCAVEWWVTHKRHVACCDDALCVLNVGRPHCCNNNPSFFPVYFLGSLSMPCFTHKLTVASLLLHV